MPLDNKELQTPQPLIISYVKDLPNICSLAGLACTTLAIYFSIVGVFYAAMIGMIWAVAFDWADGLVARRMKGRTGSDRMFGGQLDLVIDIVSYGVAPAVLLMSFGKFDPMFLPIAFIVLAASAIRLSYFSTFGLSDESKYTGLALDNNSIVIVFIFLFESILPSGIFSIVFFGSVLSLAVLNVSEIKTPKLSGNSRNVFLLAFYAVGITGFNIWKLI
ncbi:MAG: CDP-alcohol phosphatidyltransferase family protein [Cellvibrionaceae bacterium]